MNRRRRVINSNRFPKEWTLIRTVCVIVQPISIPLIIPTLGSAIADDEGVALDGLHGRRGKTFYAMYRYDVWYRIVLYKQTEEGDKVVELNSKFHVSCHADWWPIRSNIGRRASQGGPSASLLTFVSTSATDDVAVQELLLFLCPGTAHLVELLECS